MTFPLPVALNLALCLDLALRPIAGVAVPAPMAPSMAQSRLELAPPSPTKPGEPNEKDELDQLVERLRNAEQLANENPETGITPLREAIDAAHAEPELVAKSQEAHEARVYALLALARAYLVVDRRSDAVATLDEAIRVARGDKLPVKLFGPTLVGLHDERLSTPQNRPDGELRVTCKPSCYVIVDERTAGSGSEVVVRGLPLGDHRVTVLPTDERVTAEVIQRAFTLDSSTPATTITYEAKIPIGPKRKLASSKTPADDGMPKRKLPRWGGVVGVVSGAAVLVAGVALIAIHGRCSDLRDPSDVEGGKCKDVYDTRKIGIPLAAIGGATVIGFGVALGIGESRDRKRAAAQPSGGTSAMVTWTVRF